MKNQLVYIASLLSLLNSNKLYASNILRIEPDSTLLIMVKPEEKQIIKKFIYTYNVNELSDEEIMKLKQTLYRLQEELERGPQPMLTIKSKGL